MHDPNFKKFVTSQLESIDSTLDDLCSAFKFLQSRLEVVEKALNIKVITSQEAETFNDTLPDTATKADTKSAFIDTSLCIAYLQSKTNEQLIAIYQKQQ